MAGNKKTEDAISEKLVFGGYGKVNELKDLDIKDAILIVERGSDIEGELLYFSIKETNAADAGAKAMIVYNNIPGIFLGELIHEFIESNYSPRIPVVSIDRKEGLEIVESINGESYIEFVLQSRLSCTLVWEGQYLHFIKPEIVAPGPTSTLHKTMQDTILPVEPVMLHLT